MSNVKKITVSYFRKMKERGEKIAVLTAYDAPTAALAGACGVEMLLVGDSVANAVLGYRNTLPLTLGESLHHCAAVRRGAPDAFVIGDMPFMTYQADINDALNNAARYLKEAGVDGVKLEGGAAMAPVVERMAASGIPVIGHIGLLPQKLLTAGGYRIAGKTEKEAEALIKDAKRLEEAGAFCIILECIPAEVSKRITAAVSIPTIGIGAGEHCDGQVQVVNDILGMSGDFTPKHAKCYVNLHEAIRKAFTQYVKDVKKAKFPGRENSF
jgi:3-methyl-2-oxobutanoate hydroxymethyltransferase